MDPDRATTLALGNEIGVEPLDLEVENGHPLGMSLVDGLDQHCRLPVSLDQLIADLQISS
ncbi:MAG: hypothetical protein NZM42_05075 [Gemmatales bacterium]|nr:hypothetical protein [Gemmatales bacterium]